MNNNYIAGFIICIILYNVLVVKKTKSIKKNKKFIDIKIDSKKEYVIKQLKELNKSLQLSKPSLLNKSEPSLNKKLKSSSDKKEHFKTFSKNNDIIKTKFINTAAPAPVPVSVNNEITGINNEITRINNEITGINNEVLGIINAPMYASVESINKLPLDIFLVNQINTNKNNLVSFLDQVVEISNNKSVKTKLKNIKNEAIDENSNMFEGRNCNANSINKNGEKCSSFINGNDKNQYSLIN
jgi:hypothetical protein